MTEVVIRAEDKLSDLIRKVKLATLLGTIQSTYTYFPYLSEDWKRNTEEERLLGVSFTGIMDHKLMGDPNAWWYKEFDEWFETEEHLKFNDLGLDFIYSLEDLLEYLRNVAIDTNSEWAGKLGIPAAAAITCIKPSGTVSQLVDSASGIHSRHSEYYIRTVRGDNKDPLTQFLKDQGIPHEPDVMKPESTTVFSFPQKAPKGAVTRNQRTAIEQLELWLIYQRHWCEHKPSVTINVKEDEWMAVGAWVYEHFDEVSGISFLPHSNHSYQQAPYQDCDEQTYLEAVAKAPVSVDWSKLSEYETEDTSKGTSTFACSGESCEIVDING